MKNIVVVTFTEPSKAYQALSTFKELATSGRIVLRSAVVVERPVDGQSIVHDTASATRLVGNVDFMMATLLDGLNGTDDLAPIADRIPLGSTAVMAEVDEYADEVIDGAMPPLGGTVYRESTDDVKAGLRAERRARDEAEKQAAQEQREAQKQERERERAKRHNERIDRLEGRTNRVEQWLEGQKDPVPAEPGTSSPPANAG